MAKIHILEIDLPAEGATRVGSVNAIYHVNITTQKNSNLDVTGQVGFSVYGESPLIRGNSGSVSLGVSNIPNLLSTHPDFSTTDEATLLSNQDIAEVEVSIRFTEGEVASEVATRVDNLYNAIESKVQSEYSSRFQYYGTSRNPA